MSTRTHDRWLRDYQRIERAISYIASHREARPDLSQIAASAGLSEYHFQRLFSRMAGLSPKKFMQFLAKEWAKELLDESSSLLDAAYDSGLSGPGRLHDLFVSCEAVTPGEYKSRGKGLSIRFGFHPTPFGECLLATTDRGICFLSFVQSGDRGGARADLQREWRAATLEQDQEGTAAIVERIFCRNPARSPRAPRVKQKPLTLLVRGTNFQMKVWEALLSIPPGSRATYEEIARRIESPDSVRAVAGAIAHNPISYLIPCHRVIRKTGELGGYRWGPGRKRLILAWEAEAQGVRASSALRPALPGSLPPRPRSSADRPT